MVQSFHLAGFSLSEPSRQEEIEAFSLLFERLFAQGQVVSYVWLHTCLRCECYYQAPSPLDFPQGTYTLEGSSALYYLLELACGAKSLLKGEDQILGQIKKAHGASLSGGHSSALLNVAFNRAIALGKAFRSKSGISTHALSLEALALKKIKQYAPDALEKNILILGLGDLSQSIMYLLQKEGAKNLSITNRSYHKCREIAAAKNVKPVDFRHKKEALNKADIIISATGAPHCVVRKSDFSLSKPRLFLDLALPRDIEENIGGCLFTLDDLWKGKEANIGLREELFTLYHYLIDEEFISLCLRLNHTYA